MLSPFFFPRVRLQALAFPKPQQFSIESACPQHSWFRQVEYRADDAIDEKAKAALKNQADNYRKLAIKRAKELGYPIPAPPKPSVPTEQR
jgi:hypothetical protein